jgi:DNA-binding beta-propeller fold protein YncE
MKTSGRVSVHHRRIPALAMAAAGVAGLVVAAGSAASASSSHPNGILAVASSDFPTGAVTLLNGATGRVVKTIRVGVAPFELAGPQNGNVLTYLGNGSDSTNAPSSFLSIAPTTGSIGASMHVPWNSVSPLVAPSGKEAFVAVGIDAASQPAGTPGDVVPLNLATGTAGNQIQVGIEPTSLAITPNGRTLYALDANAPMDGTPGEIVPIDVATGSVESPIGKAASDMVITPNGKSAYIVDPSDDASIYPINTATNSLGRGFSIGSYIPQVIALSPNGKTLYVVGTPIVGVGIKGGPVLVTVNLRTGAESKPTQLDIGSSATTWDIAVNPTGADVFVLAVGSGAAPGEVTVVNVAHPSKSYTDTVGRTAGSIAVSPSGKVLYVLDTGGGGGISSPQFGVLPIAVAANHMGARINVGVDPIAMVMLP